MSINSDIFQNFWSPNYLKEFKKTFNEINFEGSSRLCSQIADNFNKKHEIIEDQSRKRGLFMLLFCIVALIVIGFETDLDSKKLAVAFYVSASLILLVLLTSKWLICKWKGVVISVVLITIISILGYTYADLLFPYAENLRKIYEVRRFILVVILLSPIIFQLIKNWLYSSVFSGYLKSQIKSEYKIYQDALKGAEEKNKSGVNPSYYAAYCDSLFNGEEDGNITAMTNVFSSRITSFCSPGTFRLLIEWIKYRFCKKKNAQVVHEIDCKIEDKSSTAVSFFMTSSSPSLTPAIDFSTQYGKFKEIKSKSNLSLRKFCKQENLDYEDMVAWLKVFKPGKTT